MLNVKSLPHPVVFVDAIRVKRANDSELICSLNIYGAVRILVGSDENTLYINDVVGTLASRIIVPLRPPLAEFVAFMDFVWVFCKEDTVVYAVWSGGRVHIKGAV